MVFARIAQMPVGQGGLCTGQLTCGGPVLSWVYDCGSNQSDALSREIVKLGGSIDFLFLSHLDADHVNGIDQLLWARPCVEVVLPYLNEHEVLLALMDGGRDKMSGQFAEFMADPAAWLFRRGVKRVTFLRGDDDGDDERAVEETPEPGTDGEGPLVAKWSRERRPDERQSASRGRSRAPGTTRSGDVGVVEAGAILMLASGSGLIDWVLAPQVHRPTSARSQAFAQALRKEFKGQKVARIINAVWDETTRTKLRACYDSLWTDHNLVTMSLYAGPTARGRRGWIADLAGGLRDDSIHLRYQGGGAMGWLSTGDANLAAKRRREKLLAHYAPYLRNLLVFVTPHHGAAQSFNAELLEHLPSLRAGVAAAGPNGYGHPHNLVRQAVNARTQARFVHVSDHEPSAFYLTLSTI